MPPQIKAKVAPFPSKKWVHNTSDRVTEERRTMLETWLKSLLQQPSQLDIVLGFLEVPYDKKVKILQNEKCHLTEEDHCVANLLTTFNDDIRHKSRSLENFEKHFFEKKSGLHATYMKLLIRTLAKLCGTSGVGSKSLDILYKLVHSSSYRYYEMALTELLVLDFGLMKSIKLDMHILKQFAGDTSEQALEICLVIFNHLQTQMQSNLLSYIVIYIQLNDSYQAVEIFNIWSSQGIINFSIIKKPFIEWRYLQPADSDHEFVLDIEPLINI